MPIPRPSSSETKEEFITRFMSDPTMISEYPDDVARLAMAEDEFNKSALKVLFIDVETNPDQQEQLLKCFPRGKHYIEKYKEVIDFNDEFFTRIIEAFNASTLSKPYIDKDHELNESYGDILEPTVQDDGLYFKVFYNDDGIDQIKNRKYKYISPAWGSCTDTKKNEFESRLFAISLVNSPALEGMSPTIQEQFKLKKLNLVERKKEREREKEREKTKEETMDLKKLTKMLDLDETATPTTSDIEDAVAKMQTQIDALTKKIEEISAILGTTEEAKKLVEKKVEGLEEEVEENKKEELKREGEIAVKKYISLGKIHPSIYELKLKKYIANKEEVIEEMNLTPENAVKSQKSLKSDTSGAFVCSDTEAEGMKKLRLDPALAEDFDVYKNLMARQK